MMTKDNFVIFFLSKFIVFINYVLNKIVFSFSEAFWNNYKIADLKYENAMIFQRSMHMFGRNTLDGLATPLYGRIYNFKIYENDELIRYFVPCYRKVDSVAGMYDLINDKFYINSGSNNFIVGNKIQKK